MHTVRYQCYELPENEARKNLISFLVWFVVTLVSFFIAILVDYRILVVFLLMLVGALPLTMVLLRRAQKLRKEAVHSIAFTVEEGTLYREKTPYFAYYNKKEDCVFIYTTAAYRGLQNAIKTSEFRILKEDQEDFLEFCRLHHVETEKKEYIL